MASKGTGLVGLLGGTILFGGIWLFPDQTTNVITNLAFWKTERDVRPLTEHVGVKCGNEAESLLSEPKFACEPVPTTTSIPASP